MNIAFFDAHRFEREIFESVNDKFGQKITFLEPRITEQTAPLAKDFEVVCAFANDRLNATVLKLLSQQGVKLIALRSAGFNHVDLKAAGELGIAVVRVPAYSPYSVAEHAVSLLMCLNRKVHRAHMRVHEGNFSLEGLVGFDLHGKVVGIIGTGKIGRVAAGIFNGFGCRVLAHDIEPNAQLSGSGVVEYVSLPELYLRSDIISLHVPLTPQNRHLICANSLAQMRRGVFLINTGRGALIDSRALVDGLKSGHVGAAGLDVYEEEENVFFRDLSEQVLQDDVLARLLSFPNVLLTSHQGFLTKEALHGIAETTLQNVQEFERGSKLSNAVFV